MQLLVEISISTAGRLYPSIKGFIERLNTNSAFEVVTTPTSTRVSGEHFALMSFLRRNAPSL